MAAYAAARDNAIPATEPKVDSRGRAKSQITQSLEVGLVVTGESYLVISATPY